MITDAVMFVEGHGFIGRLGSVEFLKEGRRNVARCSLEVYSWDVLSLFGVAEGLSAPFLIRG